MNFVLASIAVFIIILFFPFPIYFLFTKITSLKEPENARDFFGSVVVQKIGTTLGFVLLYYFAKDVFAASWLLYSLIWLAMFAIVEIGQAIGPQYTWKEALAGIIAEAIYFPLAGLALSLLLV